MLFLEFFSVGRQVVEGFVGGWQIFGPRWTFSVGAMTWTRVPSVLPMGPGFSIIMTLVRV